ncbi:MAG: SusF/SusE family outer membrane protein [Paludibacteraceae bacterium]|nr:SusF/SusE family outer membrane protein [Paludibacteraceae bacterium]
MKKLSFLMCAIAMMGFMFTACENKGGGGGGLDDVVEDGFYVYGPATAIENMQAANAALGLMGAGINEYDKQPRAGLYEKYIALEGGKEFTLALYENQQAIEYGATLELGDPYDAAYGVTIQVYKGKLEQNVKMTVPESGFYHIALDLNKNGDLPEACIVVAPVEWAINANSELKLAASDFNKTKMTWTLKDKEMKKGDKYKYAYGGGWKIKLTPASEILIETNLGEGMKSGAADIVLPNSGKYTFELEWNLAGGAIEKSFVDKTECTEKYEEKAPEAVYLIGQFCGWDWAACRDMIKVIGEDAFYAIAYINANEGFKFNTIKEWSGDFFQLVNGVEGATESGGNLVVAESGLYLIYLDYSKDKVFVEPAQIYGIGPAFSDDATWSGVLQPTVENGKAVLNVTANADDLRMFAGGAAFGTIDWWKHEFKLVSGNIVYRLGDEIADKTPVTAGQKVTLDFNAGTGSIQ